MRHFIYKYRKAAMDKEMAEKRLSDLGEEGIIRLLKSAVPSRFVGLDTAFFKIGKGLENDGIAVTVDMLQEKTDFPKGMPYEAMGWKTVSACLSDLATTSARPVAVMLSIACPDIPVSDFRKIIKGAVSACGKSGCEYCRGDMNRDDSGITLSGTAIGTSRKHTSRRGAKIGDLIAVTNASRFGMARAGLLSFQEKKKFKAGRDARDAFLHPIPRIREGLALDGFMNSCIDSSDGLAASVVQLCAESRVGARIDETLLRKDRDVVRAAEHLGIDSTEFQLSGGEEFELVLTMSDESWNARDWKKIAGLSVIGLVVKKNEGLKLIKSADGRTQKLSWTGWKKFSQSASP